MQYKLPKDFSLFIFSSEIKDGAMNLSNSKNVGLYAKKIGLSSPLSQAEQVHASKIVKAKAGAVAEGADGIFTFGTTPLSVRSADCVPIFLHDVKSGFVCAIHCGRKSLVNRIISKSLKHLLQAYDINPVGIKVFLGPHIRSEDYCISSFDAKAIEKAGFKDCLKGRNFDLTSGVLSDLEKIGIAEDNVADCGINTFSSKKFFSFRGNGGKQPSVFITICIKKNAR
jgi:hypothetical protein